KQNDQVDGVSKATLKPKSLHDKRTPRGAADLVPVDSDDGDDPVDEDEEMVALRPKMLPTTSNGDKNPFKVSRKRKQLEEEEEEEEEEAVAAADEDSGEDSEEVETVGVEAPQENEDIDEEAFQNYYDATRVELYENNEQEIETED